MVITAKKILVELSDETCAIQLCKVMGRELCAKEQNGHRPLFTLKLLDASGNSICAGYGQMAGA